MKKKLIAGIFISVGIILFCYVLLFSSKKRIATVTFGKVIKGNIDLIITSSGTLEATSTIDVGTQVSGKISKIFTDFNGEVKRGQLIAILDTTTLSAQVKDAKANLIKAKADYKQKQIIYQTNKKLFEKNFISEAVNGSADAKCTIADVRNGSAREKN